MSWLTACPDCQTVFRISNEQLAPRDGMVRCGVCGVVFDARQSLQRLQEEVWPALEIDDAAGVPPSPAQMLSEVLEEAAELVAPPGTPGEQSAESRPAGESAEVEITAAPSPETEPSETQESQLPAQDTTEPVAGETQAVAAVIVPEEAAAAPPPPRGARAIWWAVFAILCLLLPIQGLIAYRAQIAELWPALRPAMESACAAFGCEVGLPQEAGYLKILSSDLQSDPDRPGRIGLLVQLANQGPYRLAWPMLELTLTDVRDTPVARRVFRPENYLADGEREGIASGQEVSVSLDLDVGEMPASGYRVYVFYADS
jgi:predicted Zn finger-like uncharacterized protein